MTTTPALRLHAYGSPPTLSIDEVESLSPGRGQVVVQVSMTGINPIDIKIAGGALQTMMPLQLPVVLGAELVGIVVTAGEDVDGAVVGKRVMATTGNLGAYAGFVALPADMLTRVPDALDDEKAAALPIAALTAWQALFDHGRLEQRQRVLIHGASGAVGGMAVQFAVRAGAVVIGTASSSNLAHVETLGAISAIAYDDAEGIAQLDSFDLILDLAGEGTEGLWPLLSDNGRLVSTANPGIGGQAPAGTDACWMQMQPDRELLERIAGDVARGDVRVTIARRWPWAQAPEAIRRRAEGRPGKAVLEMGA